MRAWGRRLPTTRDTQSVPKIFWIAGRGPITCAIHVDVDAFDPLAVDDFRLADVASAGDDVIAQCLATQRKVGWAYPAGPDGKVQAKVKLSGGRLHYTVEDLRALHTYIPLMAVPVSKRVANLRIAGQVVRSDSPFELESFHQSDVQHFALPGTTDKLQVAAVNGAMLISLGSHPASNMTVNVLRID